MGTYQHVLLAVDFSKDSDYVGARAVALAGEVGARITLLHVVTPVYQEPLYDGVSTLPLDLEAQLVDAATRSLHDLAQRLGAAERFDFSGPAEIFDELRRLSAGGVADYAGITYDKIERQMGVFWPCPSDDHPGTPRLFEGGRFKQPWPAWNAVPFRPPAGWVGHCERR